MSLKQSLQQGLLAVTLEMLQRALLMSDVCPFPPQSLCRHLQIRPHHHIHRPVCPLSA